MGERLVTVDEFKTYKGITNNDEDNKVGDIIIYVSELVKAYCGRFFIDYAETDKIEYKDAKEFSEVFLDELPIISITSVEQSGDGGESYTTLTAGTDYFVDNDLGMITSGTEIPLAYMSEIGFKSLKITYKAGYVYLPEALKIAILDLIEYYRSEEYTPRKAFEGISLENVSFRGGSSFPSHIKRIFELYRRVL